MTPTNKPSSKRWLILAAILVVLAVVASILVRFPENRSEPASSAISSTEDTGGRAGRPAEPSELLNDLHASLAGAGVEDYPALLRDALAIDDASARDPFLAELIRRWLDADMEGFLAAVDELEVDDPEGILWERIGGPLAMAIPLVGDTAASDPRLGEVVRRLIEFTAGADPRRALEWTNEWLLADARESALATISGELARISPEEALLVLDEIRTPARRVDSLRGIGAAYAERDPDAALQWATQLEEIGERPYAMDSVVTQLASTDPARAAGELGAFQAALSSDYAAHVLAETGQDPTAALEGDPSDLESLPPPSDPRLVILADANLLIAREWAAASPLDAIAWVESLPRTKLRDDMFGNALAGWARTDPAAALAHYRSSDGNPATAELLFESWAAVDPEAAADSVATLDLPAQRTMAMAGVVSSWLAKDPAKATEWVARMPDGRERDAANALVVDGISMEEPELAWDFAQRIQNPSDRRSALEASFAGLLFSDPGSAEALLEAANLSSAEAEPLARMLQSVTETSSRP